MKQFQLLPGELQESVRFAFWELSGAPRVADFGTLHFPGSADALKVESLLLAASRQTDVYVPKIVEEVVPVIIPQEISNPANANGAPQDNSSTPSTSNPSPVTTTPDLTNSPEENAFAQLLALSTSDRFALGSLDDKSAEINRILAPLPNNFQQLVYWHFYNGYKAAHPNEQIGGDNWGGRNIGKDIDICVDAFMQAQGQ